ncbi:MAG TPA: tetratricopeptide repeat protein [Parvularculaceae bacterium]|nr:tetratricopeptide repeat protein [Parvularculaceae bacterium]
MTRGMSKILLASAFAGAALVLAAPAAFASGGGSGGGSMMGSTSSGPQVDPQKAYQEGIEALKTEDYKTAERKFGEVLSVAPDHPEANYYMGLAKVGRGKSKDAVRYFKRAIKARSNFVEARERLAIVSIDLGKPDDAREQLDGIKKLQADCDAAGADCSDAFKARIVQAINTVEAALAAPASGDKDKDGDKSSRAPEAGDFALFLRAPETGAGSYRTAVRLINQGLYEKAIAELYDAEAAIGPQADILNYLGYAHRKLGKFEIAKKYYGEALAIDPNHLGANEYLGELYVETGELDKARRQLAKLDKLCTFSCAEREDLARLIDIRESVRSAER